MRSYIISILKNKFFIAFVLVMVWLIFFEHHSLIHQWRSGRIIREFKKEKAFYKKQIYQDSLAIEEITNDPDALERLAREKYYMKKEGENIYIIKEVEE